MILLVGQILEWMNEQGQRWQAMWYDTLGNLFIRCLAGKAIYIGRDQTNAEIALFGGVGTGSGSKVLFIDSTDASETVLLPLSPIVRLRSSYWKADGTTGI